MRVADLFSGIGGCTLAARRAGFRPVFASEIDGKAAEVYAVNHGLRPAGDIYEVDPGAVPDHDLAAVGLPCTAFSTLGRRRGFDDVREHVWYPALRILDRKQPAAVVVENVPNLLVHDNRWSMRFLVESLRSLGYRVSWRVLDAADFGAAQVRRRLFVVATRRRRFDFDALPPPRRTGRIADVLDVGADHRWQDPADYVLLDRPHIARSGTVFAGYRPGRPLWQEGGRLHLSGTHRHWNRVYGIDGPAPTLTANGAARRLWVLADGLVRELSFAEKARLMGFPDSYRWPDGLRTESQPGNSVHVPTVAALLGAVRDQLLTPSRRAVAP